MNYFHHCLFPCVHLLDVPCSSCEGDSKATSRGDPFHGQPSGGCEDGAGVDLPPAGGEHDGLEEHPGHHDEGQLHQHHRQLQHRGHQVSHTD